MLAGQYKGSNITSNSFSKMGKEMQVDGGGTKMLCFGKQILALVCLKYKMKRNKQTIHQVESLHYILANNFGVAKIDNFVLLRKSSSLK